MLIYICALIKSVSRSVVVPLVRDRAGSKWPPVRTIYEQLALGKKREP